MQVLALLFPAPAHTGVTCMRHSLQKQHLLGLHAELLFLCLLWDAENPAMLSKLQPSLA